MARAKYPAAQAAFDFAAENTAPRKTGDANADHPEQSFDPDRDFDLLEFLRMERKANMHLAPID